MMKIYIASPYTIGDKETNVAVQIDASDAIANAGGTPFWPLSSHYWDLRHPHDWQFWMHQDLEWLKDCDALLRLPGESRGADEEERLALSLGMPVVHSVEDAVRLCNGKR